VVFISAEYAAQDWTRHECRAALDQAVRERREFILPARFDDTGLPGLSPGIVVLDLRTMPPEEFAVRVIAKLDYLRVIRPAGEVDQAVPPVTGAARVAAADPRRLGVHPAIAVAGVSRDIPPVYVRRDVDGAADGLRSRLATAAAGRGGFVLLIGGSSVGKTRAAYEAITDLLADWWLVHPATGGEVAALATRPPERTVVWLDEIQRYLDGEQGLTGGTVRALLVAGVIVVGTLWPDRYAVYAALPTPERGGDPHAREREVLDLADTVRIDAEFSPAEHARAEVAAAGDPRLWVALGTAAGYGLTQTLAAAPQLVARWHDARTAAPYAWAVLTAAIDITRLGVRRPLTTELLRAAAVDYCSSRQQADAPADWLDHGLAYATTSVHGASAPLMPSATSRYGRW